VTIEKLTDMFEELEGMGDDYLARVKVLQSDRGSGFSSKEFQDFIKSVGIRHVMSRSYTPSAQGIIERSVQTIKSYLLSWSETRFKSRKRWPELCKKTEEIINSTWQRSLLATPEEVFKGEHEGRTADRIKQDRATRRYTKLYDDQLEPGTPVRVSLRAIGPSSIKDEFKQGRRKAYESNWSKIVYTIKARFGKAKYELEEIKGRIDRADLLPIPNKDPDPYPVDQTTTQTQQRAPREAPLPPEPEARTTRGSRGITKRKENPDFIPIPD
jgi:hypothetical protein